MIAAIAWASSSLPSRKSSISSPDAERTSDTLNVAKRIGSASTVAGVDKTSIKAARMPGTGCGC